MKEIKIKTCKGVHTHTYTTPSLTGSFLSSKYLLLGLCIWLGAIYFLLFQHTFLLCSSGVCYDIILCGVTSSSHWSTLNAAALYHIERCVCVLWVCGVMVTNLNDRLPPLLSQPLLSQPLLIPQSSLFHHPTLFNFQLASTV